MFPLEVLKEDTASLLLLLVVAGNSWCSLACGCRALLSACAATGTSPLCVFLCHLLFYEDTGQVG